MNHVVDAPPRTTGIAAVAAAVDAAAAENATFIPMIRLITGENISIILPRRSFVIWANILSQYSKRIKLFYYTRARPVCPRRRFTERNLKKLPLPACSYLISCAGIVFSTV